MEKYASKCDYKEYCSDYKPNEIVYNEENTCWKNLLECKRFREFMKNEEIFARFFFKYLYP